jgi:hypothetical protein
MMRLTRRFPFLQLGPAAFLYFHHGRAWTEDRPARSAARRFWGRPTFRHPAARPRRPRPSPGQLGVHMLVALTLAAVCWHLQAFWRPAAPDSTDFYLRSEVASFKLNTTSAEVAARPTGPPPQTKLDRQPLVEPEAVPPPAPLPGIERAPVLPAVAVTPPPSVPPVPVPQVDPVPPLPPPVAPLPLPPPAVVETPAPPLPSAVETPPELARAKPPAVGAEPGAAKWTPLPPDTTEVELPAIPACPSIYVRHPGETPMLRNWKLFGATTLLVFALATPPRAEAQQDGPPPDDRFTKLENQLKDFEKRVIKSFADTFVAAKELRDELALIKDATTNTKLRVNIALDKISLLENQVEALKKDLEALKGNGNRFYPQDAKDPLAELRAEIAQLRQVIARYGPQQQGAVVANTGDMMIVNRYAEDITLEVNGASQGVVPANSARVIRGLPAGAVTYEIISPTFGRMGLRRSTIVPGDPLRVNIN